MKLSSHFPGSKPPHYEAARAVFLVVSSLAFIALGGCAAASKDAAVESPEIVSESLDMLGGEFVAGGPEAPSPESFLELPPEFRRHIEQEILPLESEEERFFALKNWTFQKFGNEYEYDPSYTAPLSSLPDSERINCFSFSNLFVAAARLADIPAQFQLVESPPDWDVANETWVLSQHINVTGSVYRNLTESERQQRDKETRTGTMIKRTFLGNMHRTYVVDLNPEIAVDAYRATVISDDEALSLFYSNRSVEELLAGNRDAAMAYGRLAIRADQESATAWNNLGVLFSRQGKLPQARQAFLTALALDPDGESAANNLERNYRRTGETEKAEAMAAQIHANRMKNPYYHYALGEKMLELGEPQDAVEHFEDAIDRKENERLFYFGLAEAHIAMGDYKKASKNLKVAKKHATPQDMKRYNDLNYRLSAISGEG